MSMHAVRVIRIADILPHPNADKLVIIPIPGTSWQCVSQTGTFKPGDLAVYIEPDYVVPTADPNFAWLAKEGKTTHRMRAIRLRGALSFGLLMPAPSHYMLDENPGLLVTTREGDDLMQLYGITRYEQPPAKSGGGSVTDADTLTGPWPTAPKFDVESLANFPNILVPGEPVVITEKIHGANARYLYEDGVFYIGSRNRWLDTTRSHLWSMVLVPAEGEGPTISPIVSWCHAHPGTILYGEVYGPVQSLKYGQKRPKFAAFAAYGPPGKWMDYDAFAASCFEHAVPMAPALVRADWDPAWLVLAENDSAVDGAEDGHMREGIVIQPVVERYDDRIGRVVLKHISARYWTSKHD